MKKCVVNRLPRAYNPSAISNINPFVTRNDEVDFRC
ncbi:Uncharacterised protein [Vibrio cholerae]|nr:Uncharacterised protein [Vibrio cholerae]CSI58987.1 Uncharacterised protein [Vibrio cholerae]CSI63376.1 Uncharacterised protein [Vibrio cholerae]